MSRSALRHLRTSRFQNPPFALGQALDSMGGDLVQNRIHFLAQKFIRGQILRRGAFRSPKARVLGMDVHQSARLMPAGLREPRPSPMPVDGVAYEYDSGKHSPQVRGMGDVPARQLRSNDAQNRHQS